MVEIVQQDAPWSFGYIRGAVSRSSLGAQRKPSILIRDMAKYYRVDSALRAAKQAEWNRPILWPMPCWRCCRWGRPGSPGALAAARTGHRPHGERLMFNYILRRLGYGVLILIGVNLLTFFLFFTVNTPDDMARLNIGGKRVTQEQIQKWKAERGYDRPLYVNHAASGTGKLTETVLWNARSR